MGLVIPWSKNVEGWVLNQIMKSEVFLKSKPSATTKGMFHHFKACLQDLSPPNTIILHHGKNNLKGKSTLELVADNSIRMIMPVKSIENHVFLSGLTTRTDALNEKGTKENEASQCKRGQTKLPFIDKWNNYSNILNSSGLQLNKPSTTRLVNHFCYALSKWCK